MTDQNSTVDLEPIQDVIEENEPKPQPIRVGFDVVMLAQRVDVSTVDPATLAIFKAVYAAGVNDAMLISQSTRQQFITAVDYLINTVTVTGKNEQAIIELISQSLQPATPEV